MSTEDEGKGNGSDEAPCGIKDEKTCCHQLQFLFLQLNKKSHGPMTTRCRLWATPHYKSDAKMLYTVHLTDGNVFQPLPVQARFKPVTPGVKGCISNYKFPLSLSVKMPKAIYFIYIKLHCINYI